MTHQILKNELKCITNYFTVEIHKSLHKCISFMKQTDDKNLFAQE